MEELQNRLLVMLPRLHLSEEQRAEYVEAITSAPDRRSLRIIIAEFQSIAADDLDALAGGLSEQGSVTEAARVRAEARQARAPLEAMARWAEKVRAQ